MKVSAGGGGGNQNQVRNSSGFNKLKVRHGDLIDNVSFFMNNQQIGGGGNESTLECGQGKIVGFDVRSGSLIDRIGLICENL
jgi:hypothetical protein